MGGGGRTNDFSAIDCPVVVVVGYIILLLSKGPLPSAFFLS